MSSSGRLLTNPGAGEEIMFLETDDSRLVADLRMVPRARGPAPHIHLEQEEQWEILEGKARFKVGRERFDRSSGDTVIASPGVAHAFSNPFDDLLRVRITWTPAGDTEHFFENFFGLAADGKVNARGVPSLRQLALIIEAHPESPGRLAGIPPFIEVLFLKAMAALGRLSAMKGSYPEYCSHQSQTSGRT